jgi:hypothetical protein
MTEADLFARALPIETPTLSAEFISVTLRCQNCDRSIPEGETVYRAATGYYTTWYERWRGAVGSICADCAKGVQSQVVIAGRTYDHVDYPGGADQQWRRPRSCRSCGRWVVYTGRRPWPRYIACSKTCQQRAYAARRGRDPLQARPCTQCHEPFTPKRRGDATLCSPRCKQAAYRARRR